MAALRAAHIVLALTDDLGWNYPGYHNPEVHTPTLDALAAEGVRLEAMYVYKYCAPTRSSFLTGRLPYRLAATRCNLIPSSIPEGTNLGYAMLPKLLRPRGYLNHHVGKWHAGFHTPAYTPVGRGFDSSLGFLQGGEDHWTHWCGASKADCGFAGKRLGAWDLWEQSAHDFPGRPVLGINGTYNDTATYSGYIFTRRVVELVEAHPAHNASLFVYWAIHNTHAPIEAPERFIRPYRHFGDPRKETFSAMVTVVDEGERNVTEALKRRGMWERTVFVWMTDNGSPVTVGGSNHPLRGGKGTNWEGGVRVPAFVCGGALPAANRGKQLHGLVAIADLYATFAAIAGAALPHEPGMPPVDARDAWPYISGEAPQSGRDELVHDHIMFKNASGLGGLCIGQDPFEVPGYSALGALRQGPWKLIVGPTYAASWYGQFTPNASSAPHASQQKGPWAQCLPGCLFNVERDPTEHHDLAASEPQVLQRMQARFKELEKEYHPPVLPPPPLFDAFCHAASDHSQFTAPYCGYANSTSYCA